MRTPDKWVVLKIGEIYKVFANWSGGYLDGDSWRLNSGILEVKDAGDAWEFIGYSGSIYHCRKNGYGCNSYGAAVLSGWGGVEVMDEETDWGNLLKKS